MAIVATVLTVDNTGGQFIVYGSLAVTGNYATHGDTIDLSGMAASNPAVGGDLIKTQSPPYILDVYEQPAAGASCSGYWFQFVSGTTKQNGVLQVFTSAGAGNPASELGAGAYPAGITSAVLKFQAFFPSFI